MFSARLQAVTPFVADVDLGPASSIVEICRVHSNAEAARRNAIVLEEVAITRLSRCDVVLARPVVRFVVGWSLGVLDEGDGACARNRAALRTCRVLGGRSACQARRKRYGGGDGRHANTPGHCRPIIDATSRYPGIHFIQPPCGGRRTPRSPLVLLVWPGVGVGRHAHGWSVVPVQAFATASSWRFALIEIVPGQVARLRIFEPFILVLPGGGAVAIGAGVEDRGSGGADGRFGARVDESVVLGSFFEAEVFVVIHRRAKPGLRASATGDRRCRLGIVLAFVARAVGVTRRTAGSGDAGGMGGRVLGGDDDGPPGRGFGRRIARATAAAVLPRARAPAQGVFPCRVCRGGGEGVATELGASGEGFVVMVVVGVEVVSWDDVDVSGVEGIVANTGDGHRCARRIVEGRRPPGGRGLAVSEPPRVGHCCDHSAGKCCVCVVEIVGSLLADMTTARAGGRVFSVTASDSTRGMAMVVRKG